MARKIEESFVTEFVNKETFDALTTFIDAGTADSCMHQINLIAHALGATSKSFSEQTEHEEKKLITSFKNNLLLLIQKTWVEKSNIEIKDRVLYQIEQFCKSSEIVWKDCYIPFLDMIHNAVFLMFGQQTKSHEFVEWAFRIDPDFGVFWWYISSLPHNSSWQEDKCRAAILLGMYFMANY